MTDSTVTPGMRRDLEAMRRADERFLAEHGAEARRRWHELGGSGRATLAELELDAIDAGPVTADGAWDALGWELDLRVDLVERARGDVTVEQTSGEERGETT